MLDYLLTRFSHLPIPQHALRAWIQEYLDTQFGYCHDSQFSALFPYRELDLPQDFFLQYLVQVEGEQYLTGPRFYAQDISRPFIEVIAASAPLTASAANAIFTHWAPLGTSTLRTFSPLVSSASPARLDNYLYVAAVKDIAATPSHCHLSMATSVDLDWCEQAAALAHDHSRQKTPELSSAVIPASRESVLDCINDELLFIIEHQGQRAGLIAVAPGQQAFIKGYEIQEEVILPEAQGQGLAAAAQQGVAQHLARQAPDALLLGTIDGVNVASQKTASKTGRHPAAAFYFHDREDLI